MFLGFIRLPSIRLPSLGCGSATLDHPCSNSFLGALCVLLWPIGLVAALRRWVIRGRRRPQLSLDGSDPRVMSGACMPSAQQGTPVS